MKDTIINLQMPLYAEIYDHDDENTPQPMIRRVESVNITDPAVWFNNGIRSHNFKLLEQDLDVRPFKKRWSEVDGTEVTP